MNFKAILVAATLVVGSAAFAQSGAQAGKGKTGTGKVGGPPASPGGPGQFQRRTPEERVERLAKSLNLNADQKKKILALYKANAAKGKTIREDKKMTDEQKRAAFGKMMTDSNTKLKTILTKEQVKKMDEMRRQRMSGGPGRGPGAGTPPKAGAKAGTKGKSGG